MPGADVCCQLGYVETSAPDMPRTWRGCTGRMIIFRVECAMSGADLQHSAARMLGSDGMSPWQPPFPRYLAYL
eukprot:775356-Rhodomonas_salina.1